MSAFPPAAFEIGDDDFLLDGKPFRILSGAIHYFRIHPDQWADRIHKARLMGLNCIETYVAWNAHAPQPGAWDVEGGLDLVRFLELVAAEGMRAIVRPGPYICAEWNGGGLPAWLFRDGPVAVRSTDPRFLDAVRDYFDRLLPMIEPLQAPDGGPIILVQIENEYGAYGSDPAYLDTLTDWVREGGIRVPLVTVDQPRDQMLADGGRPQLHRTASFGANAAQRLAILREHQQTGPLMCMEFWDGWFDAWGESHHVTPPAAAADQLHTMLAAGASVNFYMFHGGTNFGLTNGANDRGIYRPIVTSYDYDAPLDEAGNPTAKYRAFRDVIAQFSPVPEEFPPSAVAAPAWETRFTAASALAGLVPDGQWYEHLPTHDELGVPNGFVLYRTEVELDRPAILQFAQVRDRAIVSFEGRPLGVISRDAGESALLVPAGHGSLELLVEDLGRVNYGPRIGEPKGLIGPVSLGGEAIQRWRVAPLDLDALVAAPGTPLGDVAAVAGPVILHAELELKDPTDLFLDTRGWGKGVVWINGFCLGRYWSRPPQRTLYVPAPVLRRGTNRVCVFELHVASPVLRFAAWPDLGQVED